MVHGENGNERKYSFDMIRIIAMFAVIMIHVTAIFYNEETHEFENIVALGLNCLSQIAVPFFLMLSGALLLNEHKAFSMQKMLSRAAKLLFLIVYWSIFYATLHHVIYPLLLHKTLSLTSFFRACIVGHYHLWYLYMILGLTLVTPILKKIVCLENKSMLNLFMFLIFVFSFLVPMCNAWLNHYCEGTFIHPNFLQKFVNQFSFPFNSHYLVYYLLGWYLCHVDIQKYQRRFLYILGGMSLAISVLGIRYMPHNFCTKPSIFSLLYSAASFCLLYHLFENYSPFWTNDKLRGGGEYFATVKLIFGGLFNSSSFSQYFQSFRHHK